MGFHAWGRAASDTIVVPRSKHAGQRPVGGAGICSGIRQNFDCIRNSCEFRYTYGCTSYGSILRWNVFIIPATTPTPFGGIVWNRPESFAIDRNRLHLTGIDSI